MDRRRAAGLLLALAACFATATAAPTTSNHTALDIYDGSPDGCYYNFQHYGEGDRIMTNEPCLNCTCHNRMLMCYLRVCPFTKPIGQDCSVEKRADQCCPIVTCPDVPVDLLTSTTTSPAEYGPTGMGKLDKFGCSINGKYFPEGSKVPPTPNKPCEHCYCIRNMTTCVMQECTLHVDGCTPIYHKDVCCPVRYSCDHAEDEMPLLDDMSTTVRPTPGFLLTTTTVSPVTQMSQECVYDNRIFPDGALIKTEKACDHCYCMKGDIVCVVQECGTPMENEGKNCTALPPREGVCCPDTYICEGDEISTATYEPENLTTLEVEEKLTTLSPPRRTSSEGSGYRIEPDDVVYTERPEITPDIEGSGEEDDRKSVFEITTDKYPTRPADDILASTEETHEYIPLTTTKSKDELIPEVTTSNINIFNVDADRTTEAQEHMSSTATHSTNGFEDPITNKNIIEDMGSGEMPIDVYDTPKEDISSAPMATTTDIGEQYTLSPGLYDSSISPMQTTSAPVIDEEMTIKPVGEDTVSSDQDNQNPALPIESDITTALPDESTKSPDLVESSQTDTKDIEPFSQTTMPTHAVYETTKATEYVDESAVTNTPKDTPHYSPSTTEASDDEYITTEYQELITDDRKETEHFKPPHVTVSTPMLEEIEKETAGYSESENIATTGIIPDSGLSMLDTTPTNILVQDDNKKDLPEDDLSGITKHPIFDEHTEKITENPVDISEHGDIDKYHPSTPSEMSDTESKTTVISFTTSKYNDKQDDSISTTSISTLKQEEATTEPDKGLNTIPSDVIDEQVSISPEVQKTTVEEDKIPTETDFNNKFGSGSEKEGPILSSPVPQEELTAITTESAFRKEDYSPTGADIDFISTTEKTAAVTEEVTTTLTHEHTESTEFDSDVQRQTDTTLEPEHTKSTEETLLDKTSPIDTDFDITTSKAPIESITEKITTSMPLYEKETTTANQEDNEIFNEPRIPGEGDCLLNGVTYTNDSAVPSSHKCQSGCKCVSSIIKCDPIICSPPPEYMHNMDNCETIYDTPDACCPTYICDHKTETIPPQSHSQMSGTESPVISPAPCQGEACEITTEKTHQILPSEYCKSGSCTGSSDESIVPSHQPSDQIPEKSWTDKQDECSEENGCQALPVQPCEGEKCETVTEVALPPKTKPCAAGEVCEDLNIPTAECVGSDCDMGTPDIQSSYPKEICSEKEGCTNVPALPEEVCKDDKCRRKETSPLEQHAPESCEGPDCKKSQLDTESSTTPSSQLSSQIGEETDKKITTTDFLEKMETSKPSEIPDIVTNLPNDISDETMTTVSDNLKPASDEVEATTKLSGFTNAQEHDGGNYATENNEPHLTELPDYHSPMSTEILGSDNESTTQKVISPTTEKIETEADKLSEVTEPAKGQEPITETVAEMQPEDQTVISAITKPEGVVTEPQDKLKPSEELDQNENITDNILEVTTDLPKLHDDINRPDSTQPANVEESGTELSDTYTTPSHKVTKVSVTIENQDEEFITVTPQNLSEHGLIVTDKVTDLTDTTEATFEISGFETSTSSAEDVPNVTRKDSEDDSTTKLTEGSEENIVSSESPAHTSTSSADMEASTVEPSKTTTTESSDISKLSENGSETPVTPENISDKFITEQPEDFTLSPDVGITTGQFEGITLIQAQTEGVPQSDKKYSEEIETSSELDDSYVTTPKSYDDQKTTMFLSSDKSTTQPPQYENKEQVFTDAPKESDVIDTTSLIPESSSETSATQHKIPDLNEVAVSDVSSKPDAQSESETSPIEKDHDMVTNILEEMTTEPSKLFDMNTDKPKLPLDSNQEITTAKIVQPTEEPSQTITESYDIPKLPEESAVTDKPVSDTELLGTGKPESNSVTEETTIQETEPIVSTTISSLHDSKIMTPQVDTKEITESSQESDSTQTESLLDESTTPKNHNILSTAVTESGLSENLTEKPKEDEQTLTSLYLDAVTSKAETTELPEKTIEKDIPQEMDSETNESDELRTTSAKIHELTTLKPTEMTQSSQDMDIKTDHSEINDTRYEEQSTEKLTIVPEETSPGGIVSDTENAIPSSEKPVQLDSDVVEKSETGAPEITSDDKITTEKSYTEDTKYSSPEPSDSTDQPAFEDSKEPHKPEDDLIQSLVTEKYDEQTKPVIVEEDSHTLTPVQLSSSPDYGMITVQQEDDKDQLPTTPSSIIGTAHKDYHDELQPTSESKPSDEQIRTEKPSTDESIIENTTQNKIQPEDNAVTQDYSTYEPEEPTASVTPLHKITTQRFEEPVEPTERIISETSFTDKPSVESDILPTETEMPLISETSDAKQTESVPDVTKPSDVQTQTEPSEILSETQGPSDMSTLKPVTDKQDVDENITAISASSEFDSSTLKPSGETETISWFESTTASKQESSTDSSEYYMTTEQNKEKDNMTPPATQEITYSKPSEPNTETLPDITTAYPDTASSVEDFTTTRKETEIHETTVSALEDSNDISTRPTLPSEPQDIEKRPQAEEQPIPVVTQTEKSQEDSIATQTERIIPASEKPMHETTAPEEEFIIATSKSTTVQPEEVSMVTADKTTSHADSTQPPTTIAIEETEATVSDAIATAAPETTETKLPAVSASSESETAATKSPIFEVPELSPTTISEESVTKAPEQSITSAPKQQEIASEEPISNLPDLPSTLASDVAPEESSTLVTETPITSAPELSVTVASDVPVTSSPELDASTTTKELHPSAPELSETVSPESPITTVPELSVPTVPEGLSTSAPEVVSSAASEIPITNAPELPTTEIPKVQFTGAELPASVAPEPLSSLSTEAQELPAPASTEAPELPTSVSTEAPELPTSVSTEAPELPTSVSTEAPELPTSVSTEAPELPTSVSTEAPELPTSVSTEAPELPTSVSTEAPELPTSVYTEAPELPTRVSTEAPELPTPLSSEAPELPTPLSSEAPELPTPLSSEAPELPTPLSSEAPELPTPLSSEAPELPTPLSSEAPELPTPLSSEAPELPAHVSTEVPELPAHVSTEAPELPTPVSTEAPEVPKPVPTDAQPTDDNLTPDEESFPPSGGTSGYGQDQDYAEEDQTFGPGTCRYGGKVYVSAQQIPRDDPCDFCFCFRSDIICLQQSCPPPIHGCHEEPIQGFCCPRYECPVSMATTVNVTTTTTTTTTTLPPHFPTHSYKGSAQKRGCQIKGQIYKVGEVVRSSSGPCLHCTCGGDGQMKCDPKVCTPEPMLRQMIAAAVSAKRRR